MEQRNCSCSRPYLWAQPADKCMWMQIYDQIYQENFERARKEEEERAREAAMKEQQAAWGGAPQGGPPGLQNPGWGANPAGNGWQGMAKHMQLCQHAHPATTL